MLFRLFLKSLLLVSGLFFSTLSCFAVANNSDTITIAWEGAPRTLDPRYAIDADSQYLSDLLHCSLIGFDKNGTVVGNLAEKWTWTNNKTLEVNLKKKAVFADGTPVTASDVKKTYDFFLRKDLKTATPLAAAYKKITKIKSTGKHKVTFTLSEPDSTFTPNLMIGILPAKFITDTLVTEKMNIQGCGPFVLNKKDVSGIELVKNGKYSLSAPAQTAKVVIKFVKDESTRFAKLRKGEVDLIQNIISRDKVVDIAKKYKSLKIQRKAGLKTTYLGFNMNDKVLGNKSVRQAISKAINRDLIIKYILNGLATPALTMLTPNDPYINKDLKAAKLDLVSAKKLLDRAGFKVKKGGIRFTITYKTTENTTRIAIAKAIASDLKKIGIKVLVQPLEWGRFKADVEAGHVQLWSLAWVGFKDPDIYRYAFATESFAPNGGNRGKYSNPKVDKLLASGKIATDFDKRKKSYDEVQTILADELPYIFLWHEENFAVMNNSLKGFEVYADGRYSSLRTVTK